MVFIKPESALRRADELIDVGKKQRALETLLEVITSRRHRTWTKTHEPLMDKFLDLCVDLKKSQLARDGLHQYKTISQTVSVKSLEDVIIRYLKQGEQQCLKARQEAKDALVDIDDLEVIQTPESLLLSAVSRESQQDRTDRDMLVPWLKFVWESYKQCLDLLKNNNRVEKIYHDVAQMSLNFCKEYNRRTEFRKLCDTIRTHFQQAQKYSQQTYGINFHLPETQELHLTTRLIQLDTAINMELWQEAFKAIEDIHQLNSISKRTPKPQQLAIYYDKIALVFWKAGNHIFHAATILKLFILHKEQKRNITFDELTRLATKTLLSILSIPLPVPRTQIDEHIETDETINDKQKRLISLLSLQKYPTRTSLINDMIKYGVLNFVYPELKVMYEWLEIEFNPLKLSNKIEESIQFIEKLSQLEYIQYISTLRDITCIRLLQQISQVYQTIDLKRFIELAPKINKYHLEKLIVNSVKTKDVQVKIEHKLNALIFGSDLNLANGKLITNENISKTNIIQKMPNEQIRNHLISITNVLHSSMEIINEKTHKERYNELKRDIAQTYQRDISNQRKEILKRRQIIHDYIEKKEKDSKEKIIQEKMVSKSQQVERSKAEELRVETERKKQSEQAAAEREKEEHRSKMEMAINKLRESDIGRKIIQLTGEDELYTYNPEELNSLHIQAVIKNAREQKKKLRTQYKNIDFFIRAQHEVEIPLIEKYAEEDSKKRYNIQLNERERAIEQCQRLKRIDSDKKDFIEKIHGQRNDDYLIKLNEFQQRLTILRQQRLEKLRKEYVEQKKQDWKKQKELKKQENLKHEENQRLEEKRKADREKNEKLAKQAEMQRAIEERVAQKQSQIQEIPKPTSNINQRSTPHHQTKTDGPAWRRNENDESKDNWRQRNDVQRPRGDDRGLNEPVINKSASNDSWKLKQRATSPQSLERNSETTDSWQVVEKKRPNSQRIDNDRPSQQRSSGAWQPKSRMTDEPRDNPRQGNESSSSGAWKPKPRMTDETRDNPRQGGESSSSGAWKPRPRMTDEPRDNPRQGGESSSSGAWKPKPRMTDETRDNPRQGGESSSSGAWQPKSRMTDEIRDNPRQGGESSSSGTWQPKPRMTDETRDNSRQGTNSSTISGRADQSNNWRTREKTRLKSWRADNSDDENEGPSSDNRRTGDKQE